MTTTTSGVLPAGLAQYAIGTKAADESGNKLGQDAFLKLMMAQLKNQSPLDPADSKNFLSQLAQFSTVSGIEGLQSSFSSLASAMQSNQALQASTLVGRSVLAPASAVELGADGARGAVELPAASSQTTVGIYDASGQLVKRLDLGAQNAGVVPFTWTGLADSGEQLAAGTYRIRAEMIGQDGTFALSTYAQAKVQSVSVRAGSTPLLNLAGMGAVGLDAVKQLM
ncbi:MAG: flagellar hook assembly protein FlgD [Gammaproteobacteria bacterium]